MGLFLFEFSMHFLNVSFCASGEAILGTLKYFSMHFLNVFFFASGEAILGTLKYFAMHFLNVFFRCRRGDFRYTKIFDVKIR